MPSTALTRCNAPFNEFNEPRLRGVSAAENMIYYNIEPFERNAVYVPAE